MHSMSAYLVFFFVLLFPLTNAWRQSVLVLTFVCKHPFSNPRRRTIGGTDAAFVLSSLRLVTLGIHRTGSQVLAYTTVVIHGGAGGSFCATFLWRTEKNSPHKRCDRSKLNAQSDCFIQEHTHRERVCKCVCWRPSQKRKTSLTSKKSLFVHITSSFPIIITLYSSLPHSSPSILHFPLSSSIEMTPDASAAAPIENTKEQVPVGLLTCQHTPYLKHFTTTVLSCSKKPNKQKLYEVQLQDTSTLLLPPTLTQRSLPHTHSLSAPICLGRWNELSPKPRSNTLILHTPCIFSNSPLSRGRWTALRLRHHQRVDSGQKRAAGRH